MSDEARTVFEEEWEARGTTSADALKRVLERIQLQVVKQLPDIMAARPGTCLVAECVSRAARRGEPSFAITIEIKRLPDGEPAA